jgi:bacterial/archaeal transporter family-2 protein
MTWLLLLPVALAAGMAAPTQFAINSQLRQVVGGPVLAAALSFLVGTVILFATTAVVRRSVPELGPIMNAPWWMWLGGLLGLTAQPASIPRLLGALLIIVGVAMVQRF